MTTDSPFHRGELFFQHRLGVHERIAKFARVALRDHMPDQHRTFFASLPFMVAGSVDDNGDIWATLLTGQPGFMRTPDERRLQIDIEPNPEDPAWNGLEDGSAVGLLGIELETRRRNRMNGTVQTIPHGLEVVVEHSFGNCPKHIQRRMVRPVDRAREPIGTTTRSTDLTDEARAQIRAADTFYVASAVDLPDRRQVDVSHRGGHPGFVRVDDDGLLTIPDFSGNKIFNTLGNFVVNPKAGLVFADFDTGDILQLTGEVDLILEGPEIARYQGAERLWTVRPRSVVLRRGALDLRAEFIEASPFNDRTGHWPAP